MSGNCPMVASSSASRAVEPAELDAPGMSEGRLGSRSTYATRSVTSSVTGRSAVSAENQLEYPASCSSSVGPASSASAAARGRSSSVVRRSTGNTSPTPPSSVLVKKTSIVVASPTSADPAGSPASPLHPTNTNAAVVSQAAPRLGLEDARLVTPTTHLRVECTTPVTTRACPTHRSLPRGVVPGHDVREDASRTVGWATTDTRGARRGRAERVTGAARRTSPTRGT
jgi:hypothetical protein